ncbi:MAG: thioredoxin [Candidatus Omnitrophica bacterium CG1_02_41_171]|nr:MAG: thioredoxin [Candidatus Omnitrophica bacterium CG1_02_41_171]
MAEVIELNADSFKKEVIDCELPVLVDCWAPWCQPCLIVAPIVEELAKEYQGKVKFCKLNVDENSDIAARYGIMSIPTLLIFKEGKVVDQIIGAVPKEMISEKLDNIL